MVDSLARGASAHRACLEANYSRSYCHSHSGAKARDLEELVDQRRIELLRSRGDLVPAVQAIERAVIGRVKTKLESGAKLDRVETELASKTISRVDRAVDVDEPERGSNLALVAIQVGQLIREQVNFSGDAVPVVAAGNEPDQPPSAT